MLKLHEYASDDVNIRAVVEAYGGCLDAEAAGGGRGHGVVHGVEEGHPAQAEQEDEHDGERDVDEVGDGGAVPDARHELPDLRPRHLRAHDVHAPLLGEGQHGHDEDEHAHAAYPV